MKPIVLTLLAAGLVALSSPVPAAQEPARTAPAAPAVPAVPAAPAVDATTPRLDLTGGEPAARRWVQVIPGALDHRVQNFSVADGAKELYIPRVPAGEAVICVGGEGAATLCQRLKVVAGGTLNVPGPVPGVRLTGALRIGREPAPEAQIAFIPNPLTIPRPVRVPLARDGKKLVYRLTTDAQGRFTAPLLAPGKYRLDLKTRGGRLSQGAPFSVPPPEKLRKPEDPAGTVPVFDLGDVFLPAGLETAVTVVDAVGAAIPAATVAALQGPDVETGILFEALSDTTGATRLGPLDPALGLLVSCGAEGYDRSDQRFEKPPISIRCVLNRVASLEGRVIDQADRPVAGATLTLKPKGETAKTGPDGRFVFEEVLAGEHRLTVAAEGFNAADRTMSLAAGERRKLEPIRLSPAEVVRGKVIDGLTEEPMAGATVTIIDPPGYDPATTDGEGLFSLAAGHDESFHIEVEANGYPAIPLDIHAEIPEEGEPIVIELYPGGQVHATVWDVVADGPCKDCTVIVTSQVPALAKPLRMKTDSKGEALSPLLAKGRYFVVLEDNKGQGGLTADGQPIGEAPVSVFVSPKETTEVVFGEDRVKDPEDQ